MNSNILHIGASHVAFMGHSHVSRDSAFCILTTCHLSLVTFVYSIIPDHPGALRNRPHKTTDRRYLFFAIVFRALSLRSALHNLHSLMVVRPLLAAACRGSHCSARHCTAESEINGAEPGDCRATNQQSKNTRESGDLPIGVTKNQVDVHSSSHTLTTHHNQLNWSCEVMRVI